MKTNHGDRGLTVRRVQDTGTGVLKDPYTQASGLFEIREQAHIW